MKVKVKVAGQTGYSQIVSVGVIISPSEWWGSGGWQSRGEMEWRERENRKTEKGKTTD